jgi:hypothetical protein
MTQVGQSVEVRAGRFSGHAGRVVRSESPFLVVELDAVDCRVLLLHEDVRFVREDEARRSAWEEAAS